MLFRKEYAIRRFEPTKFVRGHSSSSYADKPFLADVQTLENVSVTDENGTRTVQRVKTFSSEKIQTADQANGIHADWLWFQEKWFQADSCRLSENTLLKHYTSEFTEISEVENKAYLKPPVLKEGQEVEDETE